MEESQYYYGIGKTDEEKKILKITKGTRDYYINNRHRNFSTYTDLFVDLMKKYMNDNPNDTIDEDKLKEILHDNMDKILEIYMMENINKAIMESNK